MAKLINFAHLRDPPVRGRGRVTVAILRPPGASDLVGDPLMIATATRMVALVLKAAAACAGLAASNVAAAWLAAASVSQEKAAGPGPVVVVAAKGVT